MSSAHRDRITAFIVMLMAAAWCWAAIETIPAGDDGAPVGARSFPLGMGIILVLLGLVLLASTWRRSAEDEEDSSVDGPASQGPSPPLWLEATSVAAVLLLIAAYVFLLGALGFIAATFLTVALGIGGVLGIRRPRIILGLSVGLALGIYILFGKVLGVYLPHGSWFDITF
jgi:hypothetical protein